MNKYRNTMLGSFFHLSDTMFANTDERFITVNIDVDPRYKNPFSFKSNVENVLLYEKFLSHKKNKSLVENLRGKKIISGEDDSKMWTRKEVLNKLLCLNSWGNIKLTTVNRHALNNRAGVVINIVETSSRNLCANRFTSFNTDVFDLYPEIYTSIKRFTTIMPASVIPFQVSSAEKCGLHIFNVFISDQQSKYNIFNKNEIKNILKKVKKLNSTKNLPIFIQEYFGSNKYESKWNEYQKVIRKIIPNIIICKN